MVSPHLRRAVLLSALLNMPQPRASTFSWSDSRWRVPLVGALVSAVVIVAYGNSLHGPFVFDDFTAIAENSTLRQLNLEIFAPPADTTVNGRPFVNASFALNYSISGPSVWSYHLGNLLIHLTATWLVFGLVRRTLAILDRTPSGIIPVADDVSGALVALLWAIHPLQTESVTYLVQRAESLAGLCILATVYAFVRSTAPIAGKSRWQSLSVLACGLGMASKETAAAAPLLVLLYDRAFVTGTFREAWARRRGYYLALGGTWILLAVLVLGAEGRSGSAGFSAEISLWHYLLTQCAAIPHYVRLVFLPHPLVFDYGTSMVQNAADVLLPGSLLVGVLLTTGWAVVRQPAWGFLGAWFFLLLAPSSSFVPVATQTVAEHRMYLPLLALLAGVVVPLVRKFGAIVWWGGCAAITAGTLLTWERNQIYHTELTLWSDTVAKCPKNGRAHYARAMALAGVGRSTEAIGEYETSLQLEPESVETHTNLGKLLRQVGRDAEAVVHFETALRLDPKDPETHLQLGAALATKGQAEAALAHFEIAARKWPRRAEVEVNIGGALLQLGRSEEGVRHLKTALELDPKYAEARSNLGLVAIEAGQLTEAAEHFVAVLRTAPRDIGAHNNLGYIALQQNRPSEAVEHYRAVAAQTPNEVAAQLNLGHALVRANDLTGAVTAYTRARELAPRDPAVYFALGFAAERQGRSADARAYYETTLQLQPDNTAARAAVERLRRR